MFKFLVLAACVAVVAARAPIGIEWHDEPKAETKDLYSKINPYGFNYFVETSNGITQHAMGDEFGNISGAYDYVAPDSSHVRVEYIADENGYHAKSDLLPTPPPIPTAILKSLEYLRTHAVPKDRVL